RTLPHLIKRARPPPRAPLSPYTPLFRSRPAPERRQRRRQLAHVQPHLQRLALQPARPDHPGQRQEAGAGVIWSSGLKRQPLKVRSEEHTSELQSRGHLVCRLLLEKKKQS